MNYIAQSPSIAAQERPWRALVLPSVLVFAAFVYAMHGTFQTLAGLWWTSDGYGHGFLVLGVSVYLIYLRRAEISRIDLHSSVTGFVITCGLIGVWFTSRLLSVLMGEQVTFVLLLLSLVLALYGARMARVLALPILYLFCAVPVWSYLIPVLQDSTAVMATRMSRALGVPIYLEEIYMTIPDGVFLVATVCAGISYLLAALSLSAFYALLNLRLAWTRLVLVLLALIGGVIFNWVRVTAIVLIGHHSNMQHPFVNDHIMFGWMLFIVVVVFVIIAGRLLERIEDRVATTNAAASQTTTEVRGEISIWGMALACGLLLSVSAIASTRMVLPPEESLRISVSQQLGGSSGWQFTPSDKDSDWSASLVGTDSQAQATFTKGERAVEIQIGYFSVQRQGAEAVNERHAVFDADEWRQVSQKIVAERVPIAPGLEVNEWLVRQKSGSKIRLVWKWYWVNEDFTADAVQAKVLQMRSVLSGHRSAAVVVMSSVVVDTVAKTRDEMKAWLRLTAPELAASLSKPSG